MPTYAQSISGSAIINGGRNKTLSDADLQTLLDWAKRFVPGLSDNSTNAQVLVAWADWNVANTITAIKNQKQIADAVAQAAAGVVPIAMT